MRLIGVEGVVYTSPQDVSEVVFKSEYCFMALAAFVFCLTFALVSYSKIAKGRAYLDGELSEIRELEVKLVIRGKEGASRSIMGPALYTPNVYSSF
jgi:hypothetical protein